MSSVVDSRFYSNGNQKRDTMEEKFELMDINMLLEAEDDDIEAPDTPVGSRNTISPACWDKILEENHDAIINYSSDEVAAEEYDPELLEEALQLLEAMFGPLLDAYYEFLFQQGLANGSKQTGAGAKEA